MLYDILFARHDWPDGAKVVFFTLPGANSEWFDVSDVGGLMDAAEAADKAGKDAYHTCCAHFKTPSAKRGSQETAAGFSAVWADIDIGNDETEHKSRKRRPATLEAAFELIEALSAGGKFKPSVVVHSGGGLHVYWTLHEPWLIGDDGSRDDAADLVQTWDAYCRCVASGLGYDLDTVGDLPRILRVPSTHNHKLAEPRPVRYLMPDGRDATPEQAGSAVSDFNLDELIAHARGVLEASDWNPKKPKLRPNAKAEVLEFPLNTPAPTDLFQWIKQDVSIRKAMDMKLPQGRMNDHSASGYEMWIANACVRRKYTDTEIAGTLIHFRRTVGGKLEKCGRAGYLGELIAKAREAYKHEKAIEDIGDAATEVNQAREDARRAKAAAATAAAAPADPDEPELVEKAERLVVDAERKAQDATERAVKKLQAAMGIPIVRWLQEGSTYGRERFTLVLDGGVLIPMGCASYAMSQKTFQHAYYVHTQRMMASLKPKQWNDVLALLGVICELHESDDTDENKEMQGWVAEYLDNPDAVPDSDEEEADALEAKKNGQPFQANGRVFMTVRGIMQFINRTLEDNSGTKADLCRRLRNVGWKPHTVAVNTGTKGGRTSRYYWSSKQKDVWG